MNETINTNQVGTGPHSRSGSLLTNATKIFPIVSWIAILAALGLMTYFTYCLIFPTKVITFGNADSIKVDKTSYKVGDTIVYTLNYCKYVDVPGELNRSLVNHIVIAFSDVNSSLPLGCHSILKNDLVIPGGIESGTYHLETTATYQVNSFRTMSAHWKSVDFKVVDSDVSNKGSN